LSLALFFATFALGMAIRPKVPLANLLTDAMFALSMTQAEFGEALGASHRTASRWFAGQSHPGTHSFHELARRLLPIDPGLAAEAAAFTGDTLADLGLAKPPPAHTPGDLIDIVVCAAAERADTSPRALRPLLHAAFKRARELGLSVAEAEAALAPSQSPP
jgi:transcriptional regulator with XRE-family HTH domain